MNTARKLTASVLMGVALVGCKSEGKGTGTTGSSAEASLSDSNDDSNAGTAGGAGDSAGAGEGGAGDASPSTDAGDADEVAAPAAGAAAPVLSLTLAQGGNAVSISRYGTILQGSHFIQRRYASGALLSGGKLFVSGGESHSLFGHQYFPNNECVDLATGEFGACVSPSLPNHLSGHTIVPLLSGKLLIFGGSSQDHLLPLAPLVFDPAGDSGQGSYAEVPSAGQAGCTTTFTTNGETLKSLRFETQAGEGVVAMIGSPSNKLVLYRESTGCFSTYDYNWGALDFLALGDTADGRLFIWQGNQSALFDPETGVFSAVTDPPAEESVRKYTRAVRLADGRIAMIGGLNGASEGLSSILMYQVGTDTFTKSNATLLHGRIAVTPVLHSTGKVLLMGGFETDGADSEVTQVDVWDPVADQISTSAKLSFEWVLPYITDTRQGLTGATELRDSSGRIAWVSGGAAGGTRTYLTFTPAQGPFTCLQTPWEMGRTYTTEVISGNATPSAPGFMPCVTLPIQEQERVELRVTGSDGSVGTFSFSVAFGD